MRKMITAMVTALCVVTAIADFNSALDCTDLTFTTGGDAEWFVQSDEVKAGESALRSGDISDSESTWIETTVSGSGTLSFWWKVSSEYVDYDFLCVSVDGDQKDKIGGQGGDWSLKRVPVLGAGEHVVRWSYEKNEVMTSGQDCGWLDSVSWTPAPGSMTITFETNGGEELASEIVTPGATYGELSVPSHETLSFVGWYLDPELTQKAENDDVIPFVDATLYAKWVIPVEAMNTEDISFSADGGWCVEGGTGPNGEDSIVSYANGQYWTRVNGLCANVTGAGTLTFKFRGSLENYGWGCDMYVNRSYRRMSESYNYGKWEDGSVIIRGESNEMQNVEWYVSYGVTRLSDFVWTPAPESMTITFDANGGDHVDSVVCHSSDRVYFARILPTPFREGHVFLGWYYDSAFSMRVDEDELVGFYDITLYARWGLPVEIMNTDTITFSAAEDSCWYAKEQSGASGRFAATMFPSGVNEQNNWTNYALSVKTRGYGTMSFMIKAGNSGVTVFSALDGEELDRSYYSSYNTPMTRSIVCVPESSESDNVLSLWFYHYLYHPEDNILLSDFVWTPAPESMTVSFDSEGGNAVSANTYVPGDRFGELPVPVRDGCTFLGWVNGNVLGGVVIKEDDFVPFNDVTLVAKWAANEITVMPDEFSDVAFYPNGSVSQIVAADGSSSIELLFDFEEDWMSMVELSANTACGGYLSFDVGIEPNAWGIEPPVLYVDDKEVSVRGDKAVTSPELTWKRYRVVIPEGSHTVCLLFTAYDYYSVERQSAWIRNVEFEPVAPQVDVFAWAEKLVNYRSWITNDLGRFAQSYATRFAGNDTDYEARLLHAATILARLGEDEAVAMYAAQFGCSIDYLGLTVLTNCERDVSSWPSVNEVVDGAFAVALPVFSEALADVSAIPLNWTGSIKLAAEKYHLDEDVYLDLGDVMAVRAALESALGLLYFTKGYDWTVDYESADVASREIDANQRVYRMITEQTNFMAKVRSVDSLVTSKTWMATALQRVLDAAAFMRARPADGDMHFFEYDPAIATEWEQATNLVSKALASLDGAQGVDIAEEVIGSYGSCDTSLLPNDGFMQIYLGALFSGRITQDLRPAVNLDGEGMLQVDLAAMKDPTIADLLPEFTSEMWSIVHNATTNGAHVFSSEAVPEVVGDEGVAIALKGSKDPELKKNIVDAVSYESYREWAQTVNATSGIASVGARAVKGCPNAWLSYALGTDTLIGKELESDDVKIESFSPASADGKFDFTVSVRGVNIGGGSVEESMLKANLKKVIGVEGATTLSPTAFSSDNIDIDIGTPVDGKAKLSVTPSVNVGNSFFMRVKVK